MDMTGELLKMGLPDAVVYTNTFMRKGANSKNFALVNPTSGSYTHFINHPENKGTLKGLPVTRVEAIHYNTNGTGTRREDGVGYTKDYGRIDPKTGKGENTFFINARGGDTNFNNSANGISVNVGFFGPATGLKSQVDKMSSAGKSKWVKTGLEAAVNGANATGSQAGFAWRGTVQFDSKTKEATLNVSGLKVPLKDFKMPDTKTGVDAVNYGNKPIARINNEEAYTKGANPFQRADDTRKADGSYLNHTDPVASIAGDVRSLQTRVEGKNATPARSNADAARVMESAINLSKQMTPQEARKYKQIDGVQDVKLNADAMNSGERQKLQTLLQNMDRAGVYFGSDSVKKAAKEATQTTSNPATGNAAENTFTRQVFQGKFRKEAVHQYNFGDGVRDVALGLNRVTAIVTSVFDAQPVADGTLPKDRMRTESQGFTSRMALQGGSMKALSLKTPSKMTSQAAEAKASDTLSGLIGQRLAEKNKVASAEARYQEVKGLSAAERKAIAAQVQAELNR
jgi:hypothetical protein